MGNSVINSRPSSGAPSSPPVQPALEDDADGALLRIPELRKRTTRLRWMVGLLLVGCAVLGAYAYWVRSQPLGQSYRSTAVERRTVVRVVEASGRLDTRLRYEVSASASGRLASISVRVGDSVKSGDVLARLDERSAALAVQTAEARLKAATWRAAEARAVVQAAARERGQVERLVAKGLASARELSMAQDQEARAQAALQAISADRAVVESSLATTKLTEKYGAIVAPIDGIVLAAPETPGVAVSPERSALFVIGQALDQLRLTVDVNEAEIGDVRAEQRARFEVQAYPGRLFDARVERVGIDARTASGVVTYPVELSAANPQGLLLPGMSALVRIEVARVSEVLAVREAALRFEPEGVLQAESRSRVFKLERGKLVSVAVRAGISDGVYTEVQLTSGQTLPVGALVAVGVGRPIATASGNGQPGLSLSNKDKK